MKNRGQDSVAINSRVDLRAGAKVEEWLNAAMQRAPDRFRGIRQMAAWDASPQVNTLKVPPPAGLLLDPEFRRGFAKLVPLDLSFDVWVYHPQLEQVLDLVDQFPTTRVVIDHLGGLMMAGPYAQAKDEEFKRWRSAIAALAQRPNVYMKLGGLNLRGRGFDFIDRDRPPASDELASAWKPYVETCIEHFGPSRCMFESDFPPDKCGVSAHVLWNAFKRLALGYSASEKADLFAGTAIRCYRLGDAVLA